MPIWNRGKQEHWKETPPPEGWDPSWPAIFVIANKTVWLENKTSGELDFVMETHLHGLCNGPRIAQFLQHKANTERPTLWALVPVSSLVYDGVAGPAALPRGLVLPSGAKALGANE